MTAHQHIDARLVQWGDRLFYPGNRIVWQDHAPHLHGMVKARAGAIRQRIAAVVRRAPQAFVGISGGGKGMTAIASHLRYITHAGELEWENERGTTTEGKEALHDVIETWRYGGTYIGDIEARREALNLTLSMPAGVEPRLLQQAVREFAKMELVGHRYVMVLHEHQRCEHVHLCVKRESSTGERLKDRIKDRYRWRETFAERLRGLGVEAEATRQSARGESQNFEKLWKIRAKENGTRLVPTPDAQSGPAYRRSHSEAMRCWGNVLKALAESELEGDRQLAKKVAGFLRETPFLKDVLQREPRALPSLRHSTAAEQQRSPAIEDRNLSWSRKKTVPEWTR